MSESVVITGLGAVTPLGNSVEATWKNICSGTSGVGEITRFDASEHTTKIAAEVRDFDPNDFMDRKEARKMERFSHYSVAASVQAFEDSGLGSVSFDSYRGGVMLGVGIGGFETLESSYFALFEKGPSRVPPMTIPKLISNIGPANVSIQLGLHGPSFSLATACSSGADAITQALRWLRTGVLDFVVAGGVEACITKMGIAGFNVIGALSTRNDEPARASRPFDRDRDGFVMGEGAGVVVLERREHAEKRGARVYAEVAGAGMTCDANHLTQPHPEGLGAIAAMRQALGDAGMEPEEIEYVNAHGTSTPINDPTEVKAVKEVFGDHAKTLAISSTKSMTGHLIGAAGGVEALITALAIERGYIPPTINLENPDAECDLDHVPNVGREATVRVAMSNTLGFGGHNGILVLKKPE